MIYADHASTSPLRREALEAMWPFLTSAYGNPSSHNQPGKQARLALDAARQEIAGVLRCNPNEVVFTSGGTESANLALIGAALAEPRSKHLVVSAVEHQALLQACLYLELHHSFRVTSVPVDEDGMVKVADVEASVTAETSVCSVMYANNEVGTVQPVEAVADHCRSVGVPFHTDAVQAPGWLPLNVNASGADMLSLSGHKFGGPKGTGLLYAGSAQQLEPLLRGGGQERGRRSGTENVAGAIGMAIALRMAESERATSVPVISRRRDQLIDGVLARVEGTRLTGHRSERLANHASFCFEDLEGESLLIELEEMGVVCSSGSSCSSVSDEPSHVLTAMGIGRDLARSSLRLSLGSETTRDDVDRIVEQVATAADNVRRLA